jgi:hypothetical protein
MKRYQSFKIIRKRDLNNNYYIIIWNKYIAHSYMHRQERISFQGSLQKTEAEQAESRIKLRDLV